MKSAGRLFPSQLPTFSKKGFAEEGKTDFHILQRKIEQVPPAVIPSPFQPIDAISRYIHERLVIRFCYMNVYLILVRLYLKFSEIKSE